MIQRRIYRRNRRPSERANNICRQHLRQPQYQELAIEEHLRTCGDGRFHIFRFLRFFEKINH